MEIANLLDAYPFVVQWNEVSRGIFLTEYFATLDTCMAYLNQWQYDPNQVNLECIQIMPD